MRGGGWGLMGIELPNLFRHKFAVLIQMSFPLFPENIISIHLGDGFCAVGDEQLLNLLQELDFGFANLNLLCFTDIPADIIQRGLVVFNVIDVATSLYQETDF